MSYAQDKCRMVHARRAVGSIAIAIALAGCLGACTQQNTRTVIGSSQVKSASAELPAISGAAERSEGRAKGDGPSVTSLSRADWETIHVNMPVDGTYATRTYAREYFIADSTQRQRGTYPSLGSALDLSGDSTNDRRLEAAVAPLGALMDLVSMPVRLIMASPATEVRSLPRSYVRVTPEVGRVIPTPPAPTAQPKPAKTAAPTRPASSADAPR